MPKYAGLFRKMPVNASGMDFTHKCQHFPNPAVNTGKTKVMLFKLSNRYEHFNIFYNDEPLEVVKTFIYLGVNVSGNRKFYQAQKHLSEQALKALFALKKVFDSTVLCNYPFC